MTYKIIRFYALNTPNKIIKTGLSKDEAMLHCNDLETSSSTCKTDEAINHTNDYGEWFDGFSEEA